MFQTPVQVFSFSVITMLGAVDKTRNQLFRQCLGYLIVGLCSEIDRSLPVLYLPLRNRNSYRIHREELSQIQYCGQYLKITFRDQVSLRFNMNTENQVQKFLNSWRKNSPRPQPEDFNDHDDDVLVIKPSEDGMKSSTTHLNAFTQFVVKNPGDSSKNLKKMIDSVDNVPQFLAELGLHLRQNQDWIFSTLKTFINKKKCCLSVCQDYSMKECDNCKVAHYCNEEHQVEDWSRHQAECDSQRKKNKQSLLIGKALEQIIKERLALSRRCFAFDTFQKDLNRKLFDKSFNILFSDRIPRTLRAAAEDWDRWLPMLKHELSKEPLEIQINKAWGFLPTTSTVESRIIELSAVYRKLFAYLVFLLFIVLISC